MKGKEMTDLNAVCNRHMARLLQELEDAGCPVIFREAVKSKLQWLRKDLNEMKENERDELVSTLPR
jgi:molybdopterin-biosynthesis enzyme MoeA-like protein